MSNDEPFTKMAERISHNADAKFGGACVFIPPNGGKTIEILVLDTSENEAQFWDSIINRVRDALAETTRLQQQGPAFGRR